LLLRCQQIPPDKLSATQLVPVHAHPTTQKGIPTVLMASALQLLSQCVQVVAALVVETGCHAHGLAKAAPAEGPTAQQTTRMNKRLHHQARLVPVVCEACRWATVPSVHPWPNLLLPANCQGTI